MRTFVGLFDHYNEAEAAVRELAANGFSPENISVIASDRREERGDKILADSSKADAAGTGAAGGAVLGGLAGIVLGLGVLAIPGLGPIIAGGPLIAGLTGASIGAALGGLVGGLTEAGVPEDEARFYAEGVRQGGSLVVVHAAGDHDFLAADILRRHGAANIDRSKEEREPAVASSAILERPATSSQIPERIAEREAWDAYCEDHFHHNLTSTGRTYEDLRPAYEYGFHAASDPRFSEHDWEGTEAAVRQDWSTRGQGSWDEVKEAVRCGWGCGRAGDTSPGTEGPRPVSNTRGPVEKSEDSVTGDAFDESAGRRI